MIEAVKKNSKILKNIKPNEKCKKFKEKQQQQNEMMKISDVTLNHLKRLSLSEILERDEHNEHIRTATIP